MIECDFWVWSEGVWYGGSTLTVKNQHFGGYFLIFEGYLNQYYVYYVYEIAFMISYLNLFFLTISSSFCCDKSIVDLNSHR